MPGNTRTPATVRFWRHVDRRSRDDCWLWTGGTAGKGYGQFYDDNHRGIGAHRFSWILANGPIPPGMLVCHHCDNPPCVNPEHLFVGTYADNNRDKSRKGRNPGNRTGRGSPTFKVAEHEVVALRLLSGGATQRAVAHHLGVSPAAVCRWLKSLTEAS